MKQKFFNSIAIKNGWRVTRIALAVVLLAWFGATSSAAQSKNQKRVISVRLGTANEGSRVTVVSDSALNDYEAYRRGNRFYVKIPAAQFASAVPNLSGAGFEDVQVQKAADSSIISFRLQPGTAARVDQGSNSLDVVFSTLGRSENASGTTANGASPAQSASESRADTSGPVPSQGGSSRDGHDSSSFNPSGVGRSTSQSHFVPRQSAVGSQQVSSEAASEVDPAASSPSDGGTATVSPGSLLAQVSPDQATTVEQQPTATGQGTTSSRNLPVSLGQWLAQNWLLTAILPLLVVSLPLLFVGYLRSRLKRNSRPRLSKDLLAHPNDLGYVEPSEPDLAAAVGIAAPDIAATQTTKQAEFKVEPFPLVPLSSETNKTHKTVETHPTKSVLHSLEAKPLIAEQPLSNTAVPHERIDFEVRKLLAGEHYDASVINPSDLATRQFIAARLLAALGDPSREQHEPARQAFLNHGYFDEFTRDLRTANSPAERASAASTLGKVGSPLGTAHLIAALHDSAPEVRRSAVESLGQIGDPLAIKPLNDLLLRETSRQLPEAVIRHAIQSIAVPPVWPAEKAAPRDNESPYDRPVFQAYERESHQESSLSRTPPETNGTGNVNPEMPEPPLVAPIPSAVMEDGFAVEEARLRLQEEALKRAAEELECRRLEAEAVRKKADEEARLKAANEERAREEAEARLKAEEAARRAEEEAARRAEEEAARQRAEEEAARYRAEEEARLEAEREILARSEAEAKHRAEEDARFRLEAETLRRAAEELSRRRAEAEIARLAEEEARHSAEEEMRQRLAEEARLRAEEEAQRKVQEELRRQAEEEMRLREEEEARRLADEEARRREEEERLQVEAQERRRVAEERLKLEQEALMQAAVELTRRRAEVEEARRRAEEESRLLEQAQEQMLMEEERRRLVEEERLRLEAESQRRAEEERKRVEEFARLQAEEEERRLAELDAVRKQAEERARQRAEQEQRIRAEIEMLRQAEVEQHKRIEAETRRRAEAEARLKEEESRRQAEEAARLRLEEEARRMAEEARMRAEEERWQKAEAEERLRAEESLRQEQEAQLRAQQEALRLAEENRLRAEEESRRRDEEQARLQAEHEARLRAEEESRRQAEEQARLQAEQEARLRAEEESRRQAEEQARLQAEQEARLRAEEESRRQAEEQARLQAEQEARQRAEEESRRQAAEEARLEAERRSARIAEETRLRAEQQDQAPWFDIRVDHQEGEGTLHSNEPTAMSAAAGETVTSGQVQEPVKGIADAQVEKTPSRIANDSSIPPDVFKRLNSNESRERAAALAELAPMGGNDVFSYVSRAFDDDSAEVRNAAAHALYEMQQDRAASFTRALREGSPERRRRIGAALAASGLANNAISNLTGESREKTYDAFSLLFLMAKAGEVQPLMQAIEEHANIEVRLAVVKLLALSGQVEIVPAFRRLAVRGSLPSEVRSAVMEAIYQISSQSRESAHSAA